MKKLILLSLLFLCFTTQDPYCQGWERGYCEGWKYVEVQI